MKYIEIVHTHDLVGKNFVESLLVTMNNTPLIKVSNIEKAIQFLKDNGLYNDYLLSCEG